MSCDEVKYWQMIGKIESDEARKRMEKLHAEITNNGYFFARKKAIRLCQLSSASAYRKARRLMGIE